jgi:putative IMPACT (imprinted ancient) family translation regulator
MYHIPANETESEIVVLKSRFITSIAPAFSVDDAKTYIKGIKLRYAGATHHVTAYIIGHTPSTIAPDQRVACLPLPHPYIARSIFG